MSDDTPTQRLPQSDGDAQELVEERKKSRALLFVLLGVGAALLAAIIVLLVLLLGNGVSGSPNADETATPTTTPTASDTPTPTPTPEPTPEAEPEPEPTQAPPPPPPPPPPSDIVSFTVTKKTVDCSSGNPVPITFNWNTTGDNVSFGVGTDFADTQPYETGLPAVGGRTIDYQCGQPGGQQKYSIAVFHNGQVIARQTMVIREG